MGTLTAPPFAHGIEVYLGKQDGLPSDTSDAVTTHLSLNDANSSAATHHCDAQVAPLPTRSPSPRAVIAPPNHNKADTDEREDVSLAQRRTRHQKRQLPLRFRDVLPQPPPTVPMEVQNQPPESVGSVITSDERPALPLHTIFHMHPNIFGLVHQYCSSVPPSHDPEEYVALADLSLIPGSHSVTEEPCAFAASSSDSQRYHPYPNCSSFQLGDWYWNQGVQKSHGDFTSLLDILSDETFKTADFTSTHWKKINCQLGANEYNDKDVDEWEDEDAGWTRSLISIDVPFSHTSDTPAP